MVNGVEDKCPVCSAAAKFEPIGQVRKHYCCSLCGEFVVASIAERWLRFSINSRRANEVRRLTSGATEGHLLVIERAPLKSNESPNFTLALKAREEALRG
jgi:hypothetical protein